MDGGRDGTRAVRRQNVSAAGARARAFAGWLQRSPLTTPIEAMSFWLAVLLPVLYLPLLLLDFPTRWGFTTFLALVGLHLVALSLGHAYRG
jgi:hypothetical protein